MAKAADVHERRIRARAMKHWREDGSPKGRFDEYLERSRELQAFEDHPGAALLPNPMTLHHGDVVPPQPVEEAELMENLGEFPGLLSDQGDRSPVPMTRKKARQVLRED
jgi:Protein of unknown function (DUF2934)